MRSEGIVLFCCMQLIPWLTAKNISKEKSDRANESIRSIAKHSLRSSEENGVRPGRGKGFPAKWLTEQRSLHSNPTSTGQSMDNEVNTGLNFLTSDKPLTQPDEISKSLINEPRKYKNIGHLESITEPFDTDMDHKNVFNKDMSEPSKTEYSVTSIPNLFQRQQLITKSLSQGLGKNWNFFNEMDSTTNRNIINNLLIHENDISKAVHSDRVVQAKTSGKVIDINDSAKQNHPHKRHSKKREHKSNKNDEVNMIQVLADKVSSKGNNLQARLERKQANLKAAKVVSSKKHHVHKKHRNRKSNPMQEIDKSAEAAQVLGREDRSHDVADEVINKSHDIDELIEENKRSHRARSHDLNSHDITDQAKRNEEDISAEKVLDSGHDADEDRSHDLKSHDITDQANRNKEDISAERVLDRKDDSGHDIDKHQEEKNNEKTLRSDKVMGRKGLKNEDTGKKSKKKEKKGKHNSSKKKPILDQQKHTKTTKSYVKNSSQKKKKEVTSS